MTNQFWGKPQAKQRRCCYCDVLQDLNHVTSEHIIPRSKGGKITAPCCLACNRQKADLLLIDFIILLMDQRKGIVKPKIIKRNEAKIRNAVKFLLLFYPGQYDFIFKTVQDS